MGDVFSIEPGSTGSSSLALPAHYVVGTDYDTLQEALDAALAGSDAVVTVEVVSPSLAGATIDFTGSAVTALTIQGRSGEPNDTALTSALTVTLAGGGWLSIEAICINAGLNVSGTGAVRLDDCRFAGSTGNALSGTGSVSVTLFEGCEVRRPITWASSGTLEMRQTDIGPINLSGGVYGARVIASAGYVNIIGGELRGVVQLSGSCTLTAGPSVWRVGAEHPIACSGSAVWQVSADSLQATSSTARSWDTSGSTGAVAYAGLCRGAVYGTPTPSTVYAPAIAGTYSLGTAIVPTVNGVALTRPADVAAAVSTHNSAGDAHSDIRTLITDQSSAITTAVSNHNISGAAHSDIRSAITSAVSTHNSAGDAHADLRAQVLFIDQATSDRVELVLGSGLSSSYADGVLTVTATSAGEATSLQELHSVDGANVAASSGDWLKVSLPGIDTRACLVNVWETVSPVPSIATNVTGPDVASGVELVSGALRLTRTAGANILSRLVTTNGAADYVPGVTWTLGGSPSNDGDWYTLGTSDCLVTSLDLPTTGDFTVEMWFLTTFASYEATLMSQSVGGGSKTNTSWLLTFTPGGQVNFYWTTNGSTLLGPIATTGLSVNNGAAHHVAVTRSGTTLTLWVDGVSRGTATLSGALYDSSRVLTLGGENAGGEWTGKLRQFRLSSECLYSAGFSPANPLAGPTWTSSGYATSSQSIDALDVTSLSAVTLTESHPGSTSVKYAWSFDGGTTWEAYAAGSWSTLALSSIAASGMTSSTISGALSAIETRMQASGAVTHLAYGLTSAGGYTPTVSATLTVTTASELLKVAGVDYDLRRANESLSLRSKGSAFTAQVRVLG